MLLTVVKTWIVSMVLRMTCSLLVINSMSVRCGNYLTWSLFTQSESLQPLWSSGTGAVPALCPAQMLCPGASTDGMKETLNCGEKPKASTWGLTRGDIMVEQTQCSHHQAPTLPQLWAFWVFKLLYLVLKFFCCKYLEIVMVTDMSEHVCTVLLLSWALKF